MAVSVSIGFKDGKFSVSYGKKPVKRNKGKSLLSLLDDYVVIDLETTGFDPRFDEIIELGAIRYNKGIETERYSSLVKPEDEIDEYITELTGITNDMLANAPSINEVLPQYLDFIGESTVVGHNVNFDINFIYDEYKYILGKEFKNDFVDTLRLSRKVFPDLINHKLATLAKEFNIEVSTSHRSLADCEVTAHVYEYLKSYINENDVHIGFKSSHSNGVKAAEITSQNTEFDESHPFYGKIFVFTGTLDRMLRKDAMQLVADIGGINADGVTKKTNFLVLGNNDYCSQIKDGKSNKLKKAEKYILGGQDLQILSEDVFFDMLSE